MNFAATRAAQAISGSCFDARIAIESAAIDAQLAMDSASIPPRIDEGTKRHALERMEERHTRLRAWKDSILKRLEDGYQASATTLAEDLSRVLQEDAPRQP